MSGALWGSSIARLSKDANSNVTGLVGANGGLVKSTSGNILKQRVGRAPLVRSNAATARTEQVAFLARKKILAVRFGFEGVHSVSVPLDLCKFTSVATTDDFPNAHLGTIQSVTFSSAANGTIPALTSAYRNGLLLSDWIDTSIEAGHYVVARSLVTGTNPFSSMYTSFSMTPAELIALSDNIEVFGWGTLVDYVTAFDSWAGATLAAAQNNLGIQYIECLTEARVVNVCCIGDSTTLGQVDSGTVVLSPVHSACDQLSSANVLYSPMVKGWGGSTSTHHYSLAIDVIANTPPDVLIYQVWSQNNGTTPGDAEMRFAMDIVNRCKAANIVPILITGIPLNSWVTPTNDAQEAGRISVNARTRALEDFGALVIDADSILSDGASPANYLAAYGSGTHPNNLGYDALVPEYKAALQRVRIG